eukprot:672667-Amphidinium_carterae.1
MSFSLATTSTCRSTSRLVLSEELWGSCVGHLNILVRGAFSTQGITAVVFLHCEGEGNRASNQAKYHQRNVSNCRKRGGSPANQP